MASAGIGYFDHSGQFHKTPREATLHDLAEVLGRIGERDGITAGIAQILLDKRHEIERVFFEHDAMLSEQKAQGSEREKRGEHEPDDERISVFPTHG